MPIDNISSTIRQLGWIEGSFYFFSKLLSILTFGHGRLVRYHFVAQPVPPKGYANMRPSVKTSLEFIDASDPIVAFFPRPTSVIEQRFKNGNLCLTARAGDRFAGFLWLARHQYDEDEVRCCYQFLKPEESVWDFDVYVEPDFRYGRTLARLWDTANNYLDTDGKRWSFSRISASNSESLRSHTRLGIQRIFSANFLCVGKIQITVVGICPFLHVSLSPNQKPTLTLAPPSRHNNQLKKPVKH